MILVNCGATDDIIEMLQPEDNITFFVCDRCGSEIGVQIVEFVNSFPESWVKIIMKSKQLALSRSEME